MSNIIFQLKEEHIKLLKYLRWSLLDNKFLVSTENYLDDPAPYGFDTVYEGMDLILNGKPENFNPLNELTSFSDEQIKEWDKLLSELPTAIDIILYTGTFETGSYKTRYHDRDWKKIS